MYECLRILLREKKKSVRQIDIKTLINLRCMQIETLQDIGFSAL